MSTFTEFLQALSEDRIRKHCGTQVYYRAKEYYEEVTNIKFHPEGTSLTATVTGSDKCKIQFLQPDR